MCPTCRASHGTAPAKAAPIPVYTVVSDTLEPQIETWSDPGDYPSGAGGGPLPSYQYVKAVEGNIVLEMDKEQLAKLITDSEGIDTDTRPQISVSKWAVEKMELIDGKVRLTLSVEEFEAQEPEEPEEPDADMDDRSYL